MAGRVMGASQNKWLGMNKCRVCGGRYFEGPLMRYGNMPNCAQYLPEAGGVEGDKGVDLNVYQCSRCGLVQLMNEAVAYYREVIRSADVSQEMKDFRRKQFGSFIEKYSLRGKKIIEIGCGCGEYLSIMEDCGVEAYGLEYSAESVRQCAERGLAVSRGFVEGSTYEMKGAPFDAFFMLSFLEHLPDPNGTLGGICNNLADDGVGLVEVPNFDMILRRNLFSEFVRDHLLYFTGDTLKFTLWGNGFEVMECGDVWHDYIISAVVKKRGRLDIWRFSKFQVRLKKDIEKYIGDFKRNRVAVWGAGHQALAILSLMSLTGKVKYVVDSAVFKQGKFTPATHIPIRSPDALDGDPVDAVIVMAGSYSDEVAKILRGKYGRKMSISLVRDFRLELV